MADDGEKGMSGGTKVLLALIGLAGTVATVLIPNWEKVFRHDPAAPAQPQPQSVPQQPQPAPTVQATPPQQVPSAQAPSRPAPAQTPAPNTTPASDPAPAPAAQPARAPWLPPIPQPSPDPDGAALPQIAGEWRDNMGKPVRVTQNGTQLAFHLEGTPESAFNPGLLRGRVVGFYYMPGPNGPGGSCAGTLAPNDGLIAFQCQTTVGGFYSFQLERVN